MTSVVLHVAHRGLVVMKERMFCVVECILGFMGGPDVMLCVTMPSSLLMVPCRGLVMISRNEMKRPSGDI